MCNIGDNCTGKTSLLSKLRSPGDEEIKKGSGLEFAYVNVHDEERDGMIHCFEYDYLEQVFIRTFYGFGLY